MSKYKVGEIYETAANGKKVKCLYIHPCGKMTGMFLYGGDEVSSGYTWDSDGAYLDAPARDCPSYQIKFEPVRGKIRFDLNYDRGAIYADRYDLIGQNLNVTIETIDGKPDWSTARITPCS